MPYNLGELQNWYFEDGMMGHTMVLNSNANYTMKYVPVANGEGGIIDCEFTATDNDGNCSMFRRVTRFKKSAAGVLSIIKVNNILADADTGMTGIAINVAAIGSNLEIQVKGPTALKDIRWTLRCMKNSNPLELNP
jgi:hypothetical protein